MTAIKADMVPCIINYQRKLPSIIYLYRAFERAPFLMPKTPQRVGEK